MSETNFTIVPFWLQKLLGEVDCLTQFRIMFYHDLLKNKESCEKRRLRKARSVGLPKDRSLACHKSALSGDARRFAVLKKLRSVGTESLRYGNGNKFGAAFILLDNIPACP